jgi:peptidoglycan/LPS O-acetylase OafA/YrhL
MRSAPRDSGHIRALDGIRGFAVLLVFGYHALSGVLLPVSPATRYLKSFTIRGWVGVDLFFVLSGFLITTILLDAVHTENYFKVFYVRRALRIFPLYYLILIGALILVPGNRTHRAQLFYWLNLSNLPTAFGHVMTGYLLHFWSLGIEEQFYMVWPSLIRWTKIRYVAYLCAGTIVGLFIVRNLPVVLRWNERWPELVYRFTLFRVDTLCAGALLAIIVKYRPELIQSRLILRIIFVVSLCVFLASGGSYLNPKFIRFGYTALVFCFSSLVALALFPGGWTSRVFSNSSLRTMGKYSYSFYLFHPFILIYGINHRERISHRLVTYHLLPKGLSANRTTIVIAVIAFFVILAMSALSWRFFEGPILVFKKHFRYAPRPEHYLA